MLRRGLALPPTRAWRMSRSVRLPIMSCLTQSSRPTDMIRSMQVSRVPLLGSWSTMVAICCSLTTPLGISPSTTVRAHFFAGVAILSSCQESHLRETDTPSPMINCTEIVLAERAHVAAEQAAPRVIQETRARVDLLLPAKMFRQQPDFQLSTRLLLITTIIKNMLNRKKSTNKGGHRNKGRRTTTKKKGGPEKRRGQSKKNM